MSVTNTIGGVFNAYLQELRAEAEVHIKAHPEQKAHTIAAAALRASGAREFGVRLATALAFEETARGVPALLEALQSVGAPAAVAATAVTPDAASTPSS